LPFNLPLEIGDRVLVRFLLVADDFIREVDRKLHRLQNREPYFSATYQLKIAQRYEHDIA